MQKTFSSMKRLRVLTVLCLQTLACGGADDTDVAVKDTVRLARPLAPAADSVCATDAEGLFTIERPMFPDRDDSPTFGYSFKLHPGTDPSGTTVIYIPGGPGGTGIDDIATIQSGLPKTFSLVATDPRGVGCNAPPSPDYYPDEFYNTVYIADDILAIVEHLKLDHYIVYGISYGTMVGTVIASRAEARGIASPSAVVLEGTVGRHFDADGDFGTLIGFAQLWQKTLDLLPAADRAQFQATPLPLGYTATDWGNVIETLLPRATYSPDDRFNTLAGCAATTLHPDRVPADRLKAARGLISAARAQHEEDPFRLHMHDILACHEIADNDFDGLELSQGELKAAHTYCDDIPLDRPFLARDWPISAPIYYLSGDDDPNTPPWQAQSHFEAETSAPRKLVHFKRAGHNPLHYNLAQENSSCVLAIWNAIATGKGFDDAVRSCNWPTKIDTDSSL